MELGTIFIAFLTIASYSLGYIDVNTVMIIAAILNLTVIIRRKK